MTTESNSLAVREEQQGSALGRPSVFGGGIQAFEEAQRIAHAMASSTMVPPAYRGQPGLANCLWAMELASQMRVSPLVIMQNMAPVNGKPAWSAAFLIATVNACGRFTPLEFVMDDVDNPTSCYAVAMSKATGRELRGERVTIEMAKREGWWDKNGSKWPTMTGQMLRYRAATFWTRVYAPEISCGIYSAEEAMEIAQVTITEEVPPMPVVVDLPTADQALTANGYAPQVAQQAEPLAPLDVAEAAQAQDPVPAAAPAQAPEPAKRTRTRRAAAATPAPEAAPAPAPADPHSNVLPDSQWVGRAADAAQEVLDELPAVVIDAAANMATAPAAAPAPAMTVADAAAADRKAMAEADRSSPFGGAPAAPAAAEAPAPAPAPAAAPEPAPAAAPEPPAEATAPAVSERLQPICDQLNGMILCSELGEALVKLQALSDCGRITAEELQQLLDVAEARRVEISKPITVTARRKAMGLLEQHGLAEAFRQAFQVLEGADLSTAITQRQHLFWIDRQMAAAAQAEGVTL